MTSLNRRIVSNKTKNLVIEKEFKKIKYIWFNLFSCFRGKNHFEEDYYVFQPISKYLKVANVSDINYILPWKSKGLNYIELDSIKTNKYLLNPHIDHYDMSKIRIKFDGSFLSRFPATILHSHTVNISIVFEISDYLNVSTYPTVENGLFGSVKLTKNADIDKYRYFDSGIGFDRKGFFPHPSGETGKNVTIFEFFIKNW